MPTHPARSSLTVRESVALQFASRPTLRQVLAQGVYQAIIRHYPALTTQLPETSTAEDFTVIPASVSPGIKPDLLVEWLLGAFLQGRDVVFDAGSYLSVQPVAGATDDDAEHDPLAGLNMDLAHLSTDFGLQLNGLIPRFKQAQVDYWNAHSISAPDEEGIVRHRWMAQTLRMAALGDESVSRLDEDERTCLFEWLAGGNRAPETYALELEIQSGERRFTGLRSDLLLTAENDQRRVVLWCRAGGAVRSFESLDTFGLALKDHLGETLQFDSLIWNRYPLTGDAFLRQSALLLSDMLDQVQILSLEGLQDVPQMEQAYAQLTDPARFFMNVAYDQYDAAPAPAWLDGASDADRFEYQASLLDLAVQQAMSKGRTSLDSIDDLQAYAARRLREQMLADYPVEANYFPDDLMLTVAVPDPKRDKELPVELIDAGEMTLTQLAIGHLDALKGGVVSAITHRTGQLIMDWMNPVYITRLITDVNIGGEYPSYLCAQLDAPAHRAGRLSCFDTEWRIRLQFDALRAKIDGLLDEDAWQGVVEFCRSGDDLSSNVELAPLALKLVDGRGAASQVSGMYVITLKKPATVLLYRPLLEQTPLQQYAGYSALMAALDQAGDLQDSVLQWLRPGPNYIASDGGRLKAHPDWLAESSADPYLLPSLSVALELDITPWVAGLGARMFADKRQIMLDLADRESVSNAEHRWAVIKQFSWLLFNLAAPALPGPVAMVVWLMAALDSAVEDAKALTGDDKAQQSLAAVDLINSFAMLLLHRQLPDPAMPTNASNVPVIRYRLPPKRLPYMPAPKTVTVGVVRSSDALAARNASVRANHGWGPAPDALSKALAPFASEIDITGATPANGLEMLNGKFYVRLFERVFEVTHDGNERRILGPDGNAGPYLRDDEGWRVATGFLLGSGPKRMPKAMQQKQYDAGVGQLNGQTAAVKALDAEALPLTTAMARLDEDIVGVQSLRSNALANADGKLSQQQADQLVALYDQKIQAKRNDLLVARAAYVDKLEAIIDTNLQIEATTTTLLELARSGQVTARQRVVALETSRTLSRKALVLRSWQMLSQLYNSVGYEAIRQTAEQLAGRPVGEVIEEYAAYKVLLEHAVGQQQRMLKCSDILDRLLSILPLDTQIARDGDAGPGITVEAVIGKQRPTTVDLHFQQVHYYLDLSMNIGVPDPQLKLTAFHRLLMRGRLRMAASNHAELLTSNLHAADQLYILQTAWDEYSTAIVNSMDVAREGGPLIDGSHLEKYREHLEHLKRSVNELIIPAVDQMDGRVTHTRSVYRVHDQARAVATTHDGQEVIGVEVQVDGQRLLEVRGFADQRLLARFEWQGNEWGQTFPATVTEELPDPVVEDTPAGSATTDTLKALEVLSIDRNLDAAVAIHIANGEPYSMLAALIDTHVLKLQGVYDTLADKGRGSAKQLGDALGEWPEKRTRLLTQLCARTRYPEADALKFLHARQRLRVSAGRPRFTIRDGSAMDEYKIEILETPGAKKALGRWYAHFHFANQADFPTEFIDGHLKTEAQRYFGADDAKRLADLGERIHRGKLTLAQAQGIIPFN